MTFLFSGGKKVHPLYPLHQRRLLMVLRFLLIQPIDNALSFSPKYPVAGGYSCQDLLINLPNNLYLIKAKPLASSSPFPLTLAIADSDTIITGSFNLAKFVNLDNNGQHELALSKYPSLFVLRAPTTGFPSKIDISEILGGINPSRIQVITIQTGLQAGGLTVADINGDGIIDLVYVDDTNVVTLLGGTNWADEFQSLATPFTLTLSLANITEKGLGLVTTTPSGSGTTQNRENALVSVDWNLDGAADVFVGKRKDTNSEIGILTGLLGSKITSQTFGSVDDRFVITKDPPKDGVVLAWTFNSAGSLMGRNDRDDGFQLPMITARSLWFSTWEYLLYGTSDVCDIHVDTMHSCQGYSLDSSSGPQFEGGNHIGDVNGDGINDLIWRGRSTTYVIFGTPLVVPQWTPVINSSTSPLIYLKEASEPLALGDLFVQCTTLVARITTNAQEGDVLGVEGLENTATKEHFKYDAATFTLRYTPDSHEYHDAIHRRITYSNTAAAKPKGPKTVSLSHHPFGFADVKYTNTSDWADINIDISSPAPTIDGTTTSDVELKALKASDTFEAVVDGAIVIGDEDDTTLESATVSIAPFALGSTDVLICPESSLDDETGFVLASDGSACAFDDATGVLTIAGTFSIAGYESILRQVSASVAYVFDQALNEGVVERVVAFKVNDGYVDSVAFERTIVINPFANFESTTGACHLDTQPLNSIIVSFGENIVLMSVDITIDQDEEDDDAALLALSDTFELDEDVGIEIVAYSAGTLTLKAKTTNGLAALVPAADFLTVLNHVVYSGEEPVVVFTIIANHAPAHFTSYEYAAITKAAKPTAMTATTTTTTPIGDFTIKENTSLSQKLEIGTLFALPLLGNADYGVYLYSIVDALNKVKQTQLVFEVSSQMLTSTVPIATTMAGDYELVVVDVCGQEASVPFTLIVEKVVVDDPNNNTEPNHVGLQSSLSVVMTVALICLVVMISTSF